MLIPLPLLLPMLPPSLRRTIVHTPLVMLSMVLPLTEAPPPPPPPVLFVLSKMRQLLGLPVCRLARFLFRTTWLRPQLAVAVAVAVAVARDTVEVSVTVSATGTCWQSGDGVAMPSRAPPVASARQSRCLVVLVVVPAPRV